ncbi:MAG: metalloprotease PmbA [Xanthomonadales bacterium]|nr:metalloprotease PmbA [Xanthomonadales bacterium]
MNKQATQVVDPSVWEDLRAQRKQMEQVIADALQQARDLGATAAEADASLDEGLGVSVRLGEVETVEHTRDRGLTITVYQGQRRGSASCGDLEPATIQETVRRAMDIAKYTQEDPYCGLADAELMAREFPDLDLCHPADLSADAAIERALACEQAGRDADSQINNSEGASFGKNLSISAYGNSHGFVASDYGTSFSQSIALIAGEGDGMQRDYWWDSHRVLDQLEAPELTGRTAAERTVKRLGASQVPTAVVPVLFTPRMAAGLIGHLVSAAAGSALYKRSSFLLDRLQEQLFPSWMNIIEDPFLPQGKRSAAFDAEGVATQRSALIADGCLARYILGSYSARRLGMTTTANAGGTRNLLVNAGGDAGGKDFEALVKQMDRGLIVDEVMGQGVNTVTGDYSRGAAGFWVENGQVSQAVQEVTIAGNLNQVFADIIAAGNDVDQRGNIHAPSLLVEKMTVAGA